MFTEKSDLEATVNNFNKQVIEYIDKVSVLLKDQIAKSQKRLNYSLDWFKRFIYLTSMFILFGGIIIAIITVRLIVRPIRYLKNILLSVGKGELPEKIEVNTSDEIKDIADAMQDLVKSLKEKTIFADNIGKGKFDYEFKVLSDNDVLGKALIAMQNNLKIALEKEKERQAEEAKRIWASNGYAEFGELMRQNYENLDEFAFAIVYKFIRFLNINQAGFFMVNKEDPSNIILELRGCYAYDRRKYLKKTVIPGEGLIGMCYLEKEYIYITDIPDDYMTITSGLGGATPKAILIVPVKTKDEIFGVIEMASFRFFEQHEIDFVIKIGEDLGSVLANIKHTQETRILLEQTQEQAEQLAAQEEELRQNLEELQATQEESSRQIEEYIRQIESLKLEIANYKMKYEGKEKQKDEENA